MHYSDIRVSNSNYRYVELHIHRLFKRGSLVKSIVFTNSTINDHYSQTMFLDTSGFYHTTDSTRIDCFSNVTVTNSEIWLVWFL